MKIKKILIGLISVFSLSLAFNFSVSAKSLNLSKNTMTKISNVSKKVEKKDVNELIKSLKGEMRKLYGSKFTKKVKGKYDKWTKQAADSWKDVAATVPSKKKKSEKEIKEEAEEMKKSKGNYYCVNFIDFALGKEDPNRDNLIFLAKYIELLNKLKK